MTQHIVSTTFKQENECRALFHYSEAVNHELDLSEYGLRITTNIDLLE